MEKCQPVQCLSELPLKSPSGVLVKAYKVKSNQNKNQTKGEKKKKAYNNMAILRTIPSDILQSFLFNKRQVCLTFF